MWCTGIESGRLGEFFHASSAKRIPLVGFISNWSRAYDTKVSDSALFVSKMAFFFLFVLWVVHIKQITNTVRSGYKWTIGKKWYDPDWSGWGIWWLDWVV